MATPAVPMLVATRAQMGILEFYKSCARTQNAAVSLRPQLEYVDRLYMREMDLTQEHLAARIANRYGDSSRFQNITVPIVMPAVESATTYQASVFLTGTPLFGVISPPEWIDQAVRLQAIVDNQANRINRPWVPEFMKLFRDGFKYNISAIHCPYETHVSPRFETDLSFSTTQARPRKVEWSGNSVQHLDMYNTFFDTRVHPSQLASKAEYIGFTEFYSRVGFKDFVNRLPDKIVTSIKAAFESSSPGLNENALSSTFYIPEINRSLIRNILNHNRAGTNWMHWAGLANPDPAIMYKDGYEVTTMYARILPADFGMKVPEAKSAQIWKFIIVNHQVLLFAERQTDAHNLIPILFCQPLDDGLGYQAKSLAENVEPIQYSATAMWNSIIQARRRAVGDRMLYDPSRVSEAHINNPNPIAKIPVRPAAYGKPVGDAVFPFPFRDDQAGTLLAETAQLISMADQITGRNPVRQGQFVKGNKTQREFETVMGNANGRDQMTAMLIEAQVFTPLKFILKSNILQYQTQELILDRVTGQALEIDPVKLRKAVMEFKVSDGLVPSDKLLSADAWTTALQVVGSSQQISAGYNVAPMFSYLMKTQGADLTPFEKSPEQLAYEQAVASWQVVAMEAVKTGQTPPPQPTPEQFGYDPRNSGAAAAQAPATVRNTVNNITNNITNQE